MYVRFVIRNVLLGDDPRLVGRPVGNGPLAGDLLEPALEVGVGGSGEVQVHVAAVAGVAAPGQQLARGRPGRRDVAALAVGDPPRLAPGAILEKELIILGPALVHGIEELVVLGPCRDVQNAILEKVSCRRAPPGAATWCTWGVSANRVVTYIARPLVSSQSWKLAERMFW